MKKFLKVSLTTLMALSLAACGGNNDVELAKEYTYVYSTDIDNMDYTYTDKASDHEHNVNFVEGLLETDRYGNYVGAGAESYKSENDATVWTFNIRKGIKWYTAEGQEYADYTAHDFVTGLHHAADFGSQTLPLVQPIIKNLDAYVKGQATWEEVGVKAIDDYTLQYTLNESVPYFYTMTTYTILYPINEEFLLAQGSGCKFGIENASRPDCGFGAVKPDSILYSGPYVLEKADAKSAITYVKNENYWDAENVFLDKISYYYYDGQDNTAIMEGFEDGTYVAAALSAAWDKTYYNEKAEKYADYLTLPMPNGYAFGIIMNYNRVSSKYTSKDAAEVARTTEALANKNVRLAIQAAFDRISYLSQGMVEEVAIANLRNINGVPKLVATSDGTAYVDLVEEAYKELTGEAKQLDDGQDPFYNPDKAKAYVAAAEKDGIKFPITLDMPTGNDRGDTLKLQAASMANSIKEATDGKIIINPVYMPYDDVMNACYYAETAGDTDYDINTTTAWGPDFVDPKTFVDIFNLKDGAFNHLNGFYPQGEDAASDAHAEAAGFGEYQKLLEAADTIKNDNDARYKAYAKADAYLLAEGLWIPLHMRSRNYRVTKVVPFSGAYAVAGTSDYKMKYIQVQVDPVTAEQYNNAKAEWEKGGK